MECPSGVAVADQRNANHRKALQRITAAVDLDRRRARAYDDEMLRAERQATRLGFRTLLCATLLACSTLLTSATPQSLPDEARLQQVRDYIKKSWTTLSRSNRDLPRALPDPKMPRPPGARWLLYITAAESKDRVEGELRQLLDASSMRQIEIRTLSGDPLSINEHGLLYLPRPYVVPGGRFNEMYGWDSYFIQVGLLRDGELVAARDMVDN